MRYLNLGLTISCLATSAMWAAQGKMVYSLISGMLAMLNFAVFTATAPDEPKQKG